MLDSWIFDIRIALRGLVRQRGFTALVVLTLALGIGASTAMFSIVSSTLLEPLPFADPEQLVVVWQTDRRTGTQREAASVPDFFDLRDRSRTLAAVGAYSLSEANLSRPRADAERVRVASTTANFASLLGLRPLLGRLYTEDEDRPEAAPVVVLGESLWRRAFGADPGVVGTTLELDEMRAEVIGVMALPAVIPGESADIWGPWRETATTSPRWNHGARVIGRLAPGVELGSARAELELIGRALEAEYPDSNQARGVFVEPVETVLRGSFRGALRLLLLAVSLVLLIACANVANLLLARGATRRQELAVARALGASSWSLIRRFLTESLVTTAVASVLGVWLALAGARALLRLAPAELVALGRPELDGRVLVFVVGVAATVSVAFALLPALQARSGLQSALGSGRDRAAASGRSWGRRSLVVVQAALAVTLLFGAGVMLRSLVNLGRVDAGFAADRVLRADFRLPAVRYPRDFAVYPKWREVNRFNRDLLAKLEAIPGVRAAAITSNHPLDAGFTNSFVIVGREDESAEFGELKTRMVSAGYFETNGVSLIDGRLFTEHDDAEASLVLLVNQATVDRYFAAAPVLGQRVRFWGLEREIVGVVANERMHGLAEAAPPAMYAVLAQAPQVASATVMVRSDSDPRALVGGVREAVKALDPELAVFRVATMEETVASSVARWSFTSRLLAAFALAAILLAALGIYGVAAYLVAQRRHEFGVRMALGASRLRILTAVLGEGLALGASGVALGLLGAWALSALLASLLFEVARFDPTTLVVVAGCLLGSALVACARPALRATRIDPARVLGTD